MINRRNFGFLFGAAAAVAAIPALAQGKHGHDEGEGGDEEHGNGRGNGNGKHGDKEYKHEEKREEKEYKHGRGQEHEYGNDHHRTYGRYTQRYFRPEDDAYLTQYYSGPRNLPPGLRKKYYRNGTLPPGWQQQWQPLPQQAYSRLQAVPPGYQTGYYDGYAVVVNPRTRVIYDVLDVLGALQGR